ncbi:TolC family protein [Lutibacter sp.]|uniref:TolC family protein n=1 Tax=Lutibacter sp. TaxID=1925666 RepID=UPI001A28F9E2|nr:TolC family protein [Lutibacter sp.]MBI9039869.1 TolC family protein [Lutibacter sp.]
MKLILKFIVLLYINIFCVNYSLAQSSSLENTSKRKNEMNLPPLEAVIDSVLKNNAMIRFNNKGIEVKDATLNSERIYWTRNFGFQGESRYGTLNNNSTSDDGVSNSAFATTTTKQFTYTVGFYVKFPIFDMLNRKNQTKIAELQLDEAIALAKSQEDQIRQLVIKQYQELILKQKLLSIKSQTLGNAKVNMEMVEKEFTNGVTTVSEYVRISDITSRIESEYEVTKSDFLLAKKLLEDLAGFSFDSENLN